MALLRGLVFVVSVHGAVYCCEVRCRMHDSAQTMLNFSYFPVTKTN